MGHLIIIRGLPGSGKSTFAKRLSAIHLEADQFFVDEFNNYVFKPEKLPEAHNWCQKEAFKYLNKGLNVAVSNTFSQNWEMLPYIKYCNQNDHTFSVIKCEGLYGSVHEGVTDLVIARMATRWEPYRPI